MPFFIERNDITRKECDAIVNAANSSLLGGGGVDGAIHRAAGPELLAECRTLGGCKTGEAKLTKGYGLPAKYVIHTVGPVWQGGGYEEKELLESCYRNSLALAKEYGCESVAFPLISSGVYGYPKAEAFRVASDTIRAFLRENDMTVTLVVYDRVSFEVGKDFSGRVREYVDQTYVDTHFIARGSILHGVPNGSENAARKKPFRPQPVLRRPKKTGSAEEKTVPAETMLEQFEQTAFPPAAAAAPSLDAALQSLDESFSEMLLRKIDEKGMTDAQCYKRANIDRKLFSKIRSDPHYRPSKATALAFAVALELPPEETRELLMKAGFAISHSSKFDVIVEFFILNGVYDVFTINETLFAFDQPLLGKC